MTRREKTWLAVGILSGALLASAGVALFLKLKPANVSSGAGSTVPQTEPADGGIGNNPGQPAVQLSPEEQAKIGLQITEVRRESITEEILAIGRVEEPETSIATVSTRFGGRIEKLFVNFTGQPVQSGDPIATISITGQAAGRDDPVSSIYSRDLIAAAEEYRFALQNRDRAHAASRPDAAAQAEALLEASRVRLERLGLTPDQVERVLSGAPEQPIRVTVNASTEGIVRSRKVAEGQFVNAGDVLIELTDLKTVWIKADVFDSDIARIRPGLAATITSEALAGSKLTGTVGFIDTHSDPQTRTTPVRIQVDNPRTRLNPGMVVQASFRMSSGMVLTVPREAVLDSGKEKVVYVVRDNGVFQQQPIQTGTPSKDRYPVFKGLNAGDKVVTKGVFLVDSQTRLTGGLTGLFGGSKSFTDAGGPISSAASTGPGFKIRFRIDPDPPFGAKENTIHVTLQDPTGKPVADAQVRLTFVMPAMPAMNMAEMRNEADLKWTGSEYTGPIRILTAGGWNVAIEARRGNDLLATAQAHINAR
jgi:Cu(I)/Ag(I) efflux system membrane fusion protein